MVRKINALKVRQNLGQLLDEVYTRATSMSSSGPAGLWPPSQFGS